MLQKQHLREYLDALAGAAEQASSCAPFDYPEWVSYTWEDHRSDIVALWAAIHSKLKDREKAESVNRQIKAMISAFDTDQQALGRKIAWELWTMPIQDLH